MAPVKIRRLKKIGHFVHTRLLNIFALFTRIIYQKLYIFRRLLANPEITSSRTCTADP